MLVQLAELMFCKNLGSGCYVQTYQPNYFIPAMLVIGTVNFYDFIPLSVTLTLDGGHKVSGKQNPFSMYEDEI